MVVTWFYKSGDREIGPISSGGLRQKVVAGVVRQDTPVRQGTQSQWTEAKQICGLFDSDAGELRLPPDSAHDTVDRGVASAPEETKSLDRQHAGARKPLWYYRAGDQQIGPISPGGLRQKAFGGLIQPNTLIREGSQGQWLPANQFPELFESTGFGPSADGSTAPKGG